MSRQVKWDLRFLRLAKEVSSWSKDPSTKVGAVLTRDTNIVVSLGYNGFDRYDDDKEEDYLDRETKLSKIVHAEINALNFDTARHNIHNPSCVLYTYPFAPCDVCSKEIAKTCISRVVSLIPSDDVLSRWRDSLEKSREIFCRSKIDIALYKPEDLCLS